MSEPSAPRDQASAADVVPAPRACDAAVIFSERSAAGCFEDLLKNKATIKGEDLQIVEGDLDACRVAVLVAPSGGEADAVHALLDGHHPRRVLIAGFATALAAELRRGDVFMPNEMTTPEGDVIALDCQPFDAAIDKLESRRGRLVTLAELPLTPEEKAAAAERFAALATDRQPPEILRACRERGVPSLVVRIISEEADEATPADVDFAAAQPSRSARFGAVLGALFRRPSSVKDFYQRKERHLVLGDKLAAALRSLIDSRP